MACSVTCYGVYVDFYGSTSPSVVQNGVIIANKDIASSFPSFYF